MWNNILYKLGQRQSQTPFSSAFWVKEYFGSKKFGFKKIWIKKILIPNKGQAKATIIIPIRPMSESDKCQVRGRWGAVSS